MSDPMPGLEVTGLKVAFGAAPVLSDVTLSVLPGEVVGLAGRNGAGKTTTLRAISGLVTPQAGQVRLDGQRLPNRPEAVARAGVMHVPEGRGLMRTLTVRDNLRLGCLAAGRKFTEEAYESVMEAFPKLKALSNKRAGLLSGGEQQMLAIGRGLITDPRVLMVDELSLGLAPKATKEVFEILLAAAHKRAISVLLVDQNVRSLVSVCDRLYFLHAGATKVMDEAEGESAWQTVYFK